ncbi:MAG TPA: SPOR domain-containing protein [Gammaproteobacteria bacterium]|nr:SPOR domain-containing protein [Gammaproteobacteria bacterium]
MRILFLLLILINVAVYAWFDRYGDLMALPPPPSVPEVGRLLLLSERPGGPAPAVAAGGPPPRTRLCFRAGPFEDEAQARDWLAALPQPPRSQRMERRSTRVAAGYWVHLPQSLPLRDARRVLRELREKGVEDIAITPAGDGLYVISLGVYRLRETLEERRAELAALGYEPEVVERVKEAQRYWLTLEYDAPPPKELPAPARPGGPCG